MDKDVLNKKIITLKALRLLATQLMIKSALKKNSNSALNSKLLAKLISLTQLPSMLTTNIELGCNSPK